MADDGMLMNFVVGDGALAGRSAPTYKGGRWTDRIKAKRAAQHWEKKQLESKAAGGLEGGKGSGNTNGAQGKQRSQAEEFNIAKTRGLIGRDGGVKRKRGDDGGDAEAEVMPAHRLKSTSGRSQNNNNSSHAPPAPEKGGQFISSLWTSNPTTAATTTTAQQVDETPQAPTNAPISDGSATFTTLGLSPALATHLTTKLSFSTPTAIQKSAIPELLTSDSDVFIQAQTGSGKTLTYLLPIIDRMQSLFTNSTNKTDRTSGLFALILAPTRELAQQILVVLTQLTSSPSHHWITPTCVTGGEKRKSEKARLRKGCNILIATPGRLLDHLEMTETLDVTKVRWMVMDEGDRLADQGFEKEIAKIVDLVKKRSSISDQSPNDKGKTPGGLPQRRVTILCSATMGAGVQKLGDISLKEASFIKADSTADEDMANQEGNGKTKFEAGKSTGDKFLAPAQLRQSYLHVPLKQRYVALYAVLKKAFMRASPTMKVIVFFSCADSVDFHFEAFSRMLHQQNAKDDKRNNSRDDRFSEKKASIPPHPTTRPAPLIHDKLILCKLHGSLPQNQRTETLRVFTHGSLPKSKPKATTKPPPKVEFSTTTTTDTTDTTTTTTDTTSITDTTTTPTSPHPTKPPKAPTTSQPTLLFSTDVSSRGLDLPNVDLIVQFDPPFSRSDYLHRIGRTARAGRPGRAMIFLLPGSGEEGYVKQVMEPTLPVGASIKQYPIEEVLSKGFLPDDAATPGVAGKAKKKVSGGGKVGKYPPYEDLATEFQLSLENWLQIHPSNLALAKRAWGSHVRAYATHGSDEKALFDVGNLHKGHLAKGFGLRETPGQLGVAAARTGGGKGGGKGGVGKRDFAVGDRKPRWDAEDEVGKVAGGGEDLARDRMRRMAKMMMGKGQGGMAGEFNIG